MTTDGINTRELVLEILLAVEKDETYSHIALAAVLEKYQYLTKQERGFITRLTQGTLEHRIELDDIINQFSKVKVNKMKPVIRCILRMGVCQLRYMNAVPASAACNEAVKLAERKGFRSLKGFVNGVLRNISRNLDQISYPDEEKYPLQALSVRCSLPEWMLEQWCGDYGWESTEKIAEAFTEESRVSIRVNREKTTAGELCELLEKQGITVEQVTAAGYPKLEDAFYISGYDHLNAIPEFVNGWFFVQDISSMLAVKTADPRPGDYVIDVCAAPGGKSLHAAELMRGEGMVEARDLTEYKVKLLEENITRLGMKNIRARQMDARVPDEASVQKADIVIADLPCSGLGVLRRKPEIRYRMTRQQEEQLAELQREILDTAAAYVKPGGVLLYSTCTIDRMENEENTAWFLTEHPEFEKEMERQIFPGAGDGFYFAKLIRKQEKV